MKKTLLLLAAVTLCCCFTCMHSFPRNCRCIRILPHCVPKRLIKKIEVIPVSGNCRRTEVIITRKNKSTVCVHPDDEQLRNLFQMLNLNQRKTGSSNSSTPTAE